MTRLRQALKAIRQTRTVAAYALHLEKRTPSERLQLETELVRLSREERCLIGLLNSEGAP